MANLSLGKSKDQPQSGAESFTKKAPVQTTVQDQSSTAETPAAQEASIDEQESNVIQTKTKPKKEVVKPAPWREGIDIKKEDLRIIQRPFNNNISQENSLRLAWLKSRSAVSLRGSKNDTYTTMLNEALDEYTTRRIKEIGDYDL